MQFLENVLRFMDTEMTKPTPYGWFHLLSWVLTILATVVLCLWHKKSGNPKCVHSVVFGIAVVVTILEIYKQINYSFSYSDGIAFDYQWYAFPFQFCSTPMYVGLLVGLFRMGKVHDALCAYLATFSIFAGVCVMVYPNDVFIKTVGINIQTMVCHGSMIVVGVYLLYTGYVKLEHKTILKAMAVFACAVGIAVVMNEIAYFTGLLETETFNMFFISPHCDPSLPVYSMVQELVAYPWCLILYIWGFTTASYLILLMAMGIHRSSISARKIFGGKKIVA